MAQADRIHELLLELENPASPGNRGQLLGRALRTAGALVDADASAVVLASARRATERLVLHAGSELPAAVPLVAEGSEVLRTLGVEVKTIALPDLSEQPAFAEGDACPGVEAGPALFVPIPRAEREPAYIAVYRRHGRARFSPGETQSLLLLAAWLGAALERRRLAGRTARGEEKGEAAHDRALRTALRKEIRRAHRHTQELSLVLVAIDPSAAGNDAAWPTAIAADVAELLGTQVRDIDIVGRCSGGLTAVVLPQTGRHGAVEVAARMRAAIAAQAFTPRAAGAVTATLGVASFPRDGVDLETLWAVTERVLREARERGGNCVETPAHRTPQAPPGRRLGAG